MLKSVAETKPAPSKSPLPLSRSINLTNTKFKELMNDDVRRSNNLVNTSRTPERSPMLNRESMMSTSMNFGRREDVSPSRVSRFQKENEIKSRYLHRKERSLTNIKQFKKDLYNLKTRKYELLTKQSESSVFFAMHKKVKPAPAVMMRKYFLLFAEAKSGTKEMRTAIDKAKQWNKAFLENEVD